MKRRHDTASLMPTTNAHDAQPPQSASHHVDYDPRQLDIDRRRNDQRLKSRFEHIFTKYERDFEGVGDEIDLSTGKIVVNNGHLQHMQHEADPGKSASSLLAQAFQKELEHEEEEDDDDDDDDDAEGGAEVLREYRDEPLHSPGLEDIPTVTSRPPKLTVLSDPEDTDRPIPRLARLIAGDNTPQRADSRSGGEQVPDAPSSAITISGLATPLLARAPGLYQSLREAQPDTGRRSVAPEAVKALGVSIANQLAQYMPGSGQRKKKANESRLSLPIGVSDPVWAYPELPASVIQKRQRPPSPISSKPGSSPAPDTAGQESLWTAEGVVRPRKKQRTKAEMANGTPASEMPLVIRPSSSGKLTQVAELRRCWNCSLTRTSIWQKGPHGQDLCMSCGTYFERYRRMKPFDSPTPEPEERSTEHVRIAINRIDDHEAEEGQASHEPEEPLHDVQGGDDEGVTRSSPPSLHDEGDDAPVEERTHRSPDTSILGVSPTLEGECVRNSAVVEAPSLEISATTQDKPIAFVMLPKRTVQNVPQSEPLIPQHASHRNMDDGSNVELHDNEHGDLMDDYVNGFEVTPAGQIERQLNPLLHHGPPKQLAGTTGAASSAVETPMLDSSAPTTPTSSGDGTSEPHDEAPPHDVPHTTLCKNSAWNNSQDELLLELREEQDLEWEDISGLLPGHSPEAVERRYELLIDAAAHNMRITSQTTAPEPVALPQHTSTTTQGTSAKDNGGILSSKRQRLQGPEVDVVSHADGELSVATASVHAEVSPSDSAATSRMAASVAASVQPFSSPADDCSPLPDYRCHSEDAVDMITHRTSQADTTIQWTGSGATPSTDDRQTFALIDEVFDNAELTDPSQQLFREMGSSPSPAPALEDAGCASKTPPPVDESIQNLEAALLVEQNAASNKSERPAIRSPYRSRKRLSDQSARDSVAESGDLSFSSQAMDPSGDNSASSEQRPRLSYAQLVEAAFIAHDRRTMRLVDVSAWVEYKYPWFRTLKDSPLKACIRATLSARPQFERVNMLDGTKAWRFLKPLNPIGAKIRNRRRSRRMTVGADFADSDPMDVSQFIEEEDELATPKVTSMRKSLLRELVSPRMSTPVPIFVQSTKKLGKRRSSGRAFLDVDKGTPVREVDPDEDELAAL